jgi:hypothetical protein
MATLWLIIWLPCLLTLFCVLVGVANLWLARIELENALEAAALAAVKEWGDAGPLADTIEPREAGVAYAAANIVRGNPVVIGPNYAPFGGGPNENLQSDPSSASPPAAGKLAAARSASIVIPASPEGNLVFGAIDDSDPANVTFDASVKPSPCGGGPLKHGVRAQANIPVQPLNLGFLGSLTQYSIRAKATAQYDCASGRVKLVRIDTFVFP